jgi:hypothetical protein
VDKDSGSDGPIPKMLLSSVLIAHGLTNFTLKRLVDDEFLPMIRVSKKLMLSPELPPIPVSPPLCPFD